MVNINVSGDFNAALENKFNKDVANLKKDDVLVASITSHGGDVEVLKRMTATVLAFKQKGGKFVTFVPEYADSAGFFFFLLGDHREIAEDATVHYHPPRVKLDPNFVGTMTNLNKVMVSLSEYQTFTNGIFKASCNISEELFSLLENSELPMNREHLKSLGIIN